MTPRMVVTAAVTMWLVAISLSLAAAWLGALNRLDWQTAFGDFLPGLTLDALTFCTVGALIVIRRPAQPIGWLLCSSGIGAGLMVLATEYARYGLLTQPGAVSGATLVTWFGAWGWILGFGIPVELLVLLFPTGHLPSPAWRPLVWLIVGLLTGAAGLEAFGSVPLSSLPAVPNPFGIEPISADATRLAPLLLLPGPIAMVVTVIARYRCARGHERLPLKWFAFPFLAIAIAIAILRHRLYDIDRLINRTLVYGLLTIVGSTLGVIGLFRPLRVRIQTLVDRRFDREKYDTARTLTEFGTRIQNEVELENLTTELLEVVRQTIRPAVTSLWLKPTGAQRVQLMERR